MALLKGRQSGLFGPGRLPGISDEAFRFRKRRGAQEFSRHFMRRAGGDASPAHDAGIDIVKLVRVRLQAKLSG